MTSFHLSDATLPQMTSGQMWERFDMRPGDAIPGKSTELSVFLFDEGVTEYPTVDFVEGLSAYIAQRAVTIEQQQPLDCIRILEVAAGRGLFSALIKDALREQDMDCTMVACDVRRRPYSMDHVREVDYREALRVVQPHIVFGAWLPRAVSVADIRRAPHTEEIILVGKTQGYGRHAQPEAWGLDEDDQPVPKPTYITDGYRRHNLRWLREQQICFKTTTEEPYPSETVAFTRQPR